MFFPNFYSDLAPFNSAHGYLPEDEVQSSYLISNIPLKFVPSHLKDVKETLIKSFS
jgi:hypothetical protein